MKTNQKGFSLVEALLIIILIIIVSFVGWYVYNSQKNDDGIVNSTAQSKTTKNQTTSSINLSKKYADTGKNFTVNYPSNWRLKVENPPKDPRGDGASEATITSPRGTVLHLEAGYGGKGGDCQPAPDDKPFQVGNQCPTTEYLSSEKLMNIKNNYYAKQINQADGSIDFKYEKTDVVLVTSHYSEPKGKSTYIIGVIQSNPSFNVEVNKPEMGYQFNYTSLTVYDSKGNFFPYIYVYAQGNNREFLQSQDAKTIKAILQTLQLTAAME